MTHKDITNIKFGRLTAINYVYTDNKRRAIWYCECDCGNFCEKAAQELANKHVRSCGCLFIEMLHEVNKKYNNYDLSGDFGIGYTEKGYYFYFDIEDYDLIKNYCWRTKEDCQNSYFVSSEPITQKHIYLHKLITGILGENEVDHINRLKYDNRKSELRPANGSLNTANREIGKNNTSGYIGVYQEKRYGKWVARITVNNGEIWLGQYSNIIDALIARLQAELYYFGEFAPQKHLFDQYNIR